MTLELRLLLACARVLASQEDKATIRRVLHEGIDWTRFARTAIDHGVAGLAAHTLNSVAPDLIPDEIRDSLRASLDQTRQRNLALLGELGRVIEALANNGVEAIPFKGPVLGILAYRDLDLCTIRVLDVLIRDRDIVPTMAALRRLGYERQEQLTAAQFDFIRRLQGQEIVFKKAPGTGVALHTRLTPMNIVLDIDYPSLWRRAQRTTLNGRSMMTLAPEDDVIVLAIHGGKALWWDVKSACDFAVFIGSHSSLDWPTIVERAREQGCLRMLLLATSLAREYFNAAIPDAIVAAERADATIEPAVDRIVAHWQADEPISPPSNRTISMDRLRLHDGLVRQARYVARTLFLPGPHHVASMPLPKGLSFAYVPVKIAHDILALPLWRGYRRVRATAGRLWHALANSDLTLAIMPASPEHRLSIERYQTARAAAEQGLAVNPNDGAAWRNLGDALSGLKRYKQAIACYDKALPFEPDNSVIWEKRAAAMEQIGRKAGLPDVALNPQDANTWAMRAVYLQVSRCFAEAAEASDHALALDPENMAATLVGIHSRIKACDWRRREDDKRRISEGLKAGLHVIAPLNHRAICNSEAEHLILARLRGKRFPPSAKPLWQGESYRHDKIRIAYISTDFHDHVLSEAIVGCFEQHDKTRFDTTAISLGANSESQMRRRIEAAVDRFIDVQAKSDTEVASILRGLEIDIAIDLNGYSGDGRTGILAHRPAPVQVNYLAYPGTMGVPFMDYVIADRMLIPQENRIYYDEQVIYLPHTYLPNDRNRPVAEVTPSRTEAGLPEKGFVFACHNSEHKIGPEMFDIWMRLLKTVEGSVLWLRSLNPSAMGNLWREARACGVAPERIVFAPRVPQIEDHLARLRLADLCLDTLPYNAHATACDALWVGLPVLTCPGNTFPARVAASVLLAIGLPELVASSPAEYEELARSLARDPERLAAIKVKLMRNRDTEPLFDTARFTRDLETAYTAMWVRTQRGEAPESFAVES